MSRKLNGPIKKFHGLKTKMYITITNNISYDQRMNRIATTLADHFDLCLIGTTTRNPPPLKTKMYRQKRLYTFFKKGKFFYLEFNIRLILFLLFRKVDQLYTVDLDTIFAGFVLRKMKSFKWIFDAHEYFTELPEIQHRHRTKKIWQQLAHRSIPKTDLRFTVNQPLAQELQKKYKVEFDYVRNMPFKWITSPAPNDRKILLYQGAINIGRGIPQLIDAIATLDHVECWICGDGPERAEYEQLAQQKCPDKVQFLGMKTPEELAEITAQAHIGLNLLESESLNYYYSLANKFFDYTMAGIPSINMTFPVYQKLNAQFEVAILIPDLKQSTLTKAIQQIQMEEQYQHLQQNCFEAREYWNWEEEEKRLLQLILDDH